MAQTLTSCPMHSPPAPWELLATPIAASSDRNEPNIVGPVVTQDPHKPGPNGANTYFLPDAFTSGPLGTFGDANRRFFHRPAIVNTDFEMSKRIPITESMAIDLRGEFFNIFNHTQRSEEHTS